MVENCISNNKRKKWGLFNRKASKKAMDSQLLGTLAGGKVNTEYHIDAIEAENEEVKDFLFTLGCYEGEKVTLISRIGDQYVIVVKDARYSIDKDLAASIKISTI